jgi:hypothetical protein
MITFKALLITILAKQERLFTIGLLKKILAMVNSAKLFEKRNVIFSRTYLAGTLLTVGKADKDE